MAFSALLNTLVSWHLQRVGKRTDSMALLADAAHLRTDVYTSLGVVVGLGLFQLTGLLWLDSVTAMAVALLIVYEAWVITRRSVGDLLDESLPPEEQQAIERIMKERGVTYHSLRSRKSGPTRKIDLHLDVSPKATAEQVHELCDQVERDVEEALPHTQVLIHPEPMSQLDGTREVRWRVKRVLNAHQQRYVSYSDLCAHEATDGVHVALRLHVDGSLKVREARRLASQLETEIKQRVDAAAVYVCVEPPKPVPEPQAQGQDESDLGSEPV
jgi:divalent metal cation (Fe/Co/Zn/Cd) transporter